MTVFYRLGNALYVNITNVCPSDCIFCIRNSTDSVGDAKSLWLEREPTLAEIILAFDKRKDLSEVSEVVFCGFGEPMVRANDVIEISKYIKKIHPNLPIRVNTNGLVRLIHPSFDISKLSIVDSVSISLNADTADEFVRLTKPSFGYESYAELLKFAQDVKKFANVTLTVLDLLESERIKNCSRMAQEMGVAFRVR